jgi:hypothetical protein
LNQLSQGRVIIFLCGLPFIEDFLRVVEYVKKTGGCGVPLYLGHGDNTPSISE